MKCKLYFILSSNGSISNEGTTPPNEVSEFVSNATLTISEWEQVRKDMRKIMTQFLKQIPHIRTAHPTGETVIIPKSEYDGMKNTIAAQAARIEVLEKENIELRRENAELRQQVAELQRENSELRKTVEMLIHRIEFLEAKN